MLYYFRNPVNYVFFNEALILVAMHSFGLEQEWQEGVDKDILFEKTCFLTTILKAEEFIKDYISDKNRGFFDELITKMVGYRCLFIKEGE